MPHHVEDKVLLVQNVSGCELLDDIYSNINIVSAQSVITPEFVSIPVHVQWTVCAFGWLNVVVFSRFRYIVYNHVWGQYKGKELTPINALFLVVFLFQHIFIVTFQCYETLITLFGMSFEEIVGSTCLCVPLRLLRSFEQFYNVIGSLGIAFYRLLLIKYNDFVINRIGQKSLVAIILVCGLLLTLLLSLPAFHLLEPLRPKCMLLPKYNILQILDDYGQSIGMPPVLPLMMQLRVSSVVGMMLLTSSELGVYFTIFYFLYKHDNSENFRRILDYKNIKARNKKNAVTFFAQFCSFVIELLFMILCINALKFGNSNNYVYYSLTILKKTCWTIMAIIEVLASSTLRSRVLS